MKRRNRSSPKGPFSPRSHRDPVSQTPFLPPQPQGSRLPPWCLAKVTNSDCTTICPPPRPTSTNCRPLTVSSPSPQGLAADWPLAARTGLEGRPLIGRRHCSPGDGEDCHKAGACPRTGLARSGAGPGGACACCPLEVGNGPGAGGGAGSAVACSNSGSGTAVLGCHHVNVIYTGFGVTEVLLPVVSPDSKRIQICLPKGDLFDRNTKLEWYCNYSATL